MGLFYLSEKILFLEQMATLSSASALFFRYSKRRDVTKLRKGVKYILSGIQDMIAEDLDLISLIEANLFKICSRLKFDFFSF